MPHLHGSLDDLSKATQCHQGLSIDFGFMVQVSKNSSRYKENLGFNHESCYVIISDHFSGMLSGKAFKSKAPPLQYFHRWLSAFSPNSQQKYVHFNQGGELGKCRAVHDLFAKHGYDVQLTGANASHQNGLAKCPHQAIGNWECHARVIGRLILACYFLAICLLPLSPLVKLHHP
jgi:hypothetical protein